MAFIPSVLQLRAKALAIPMAVNVAGSILDDPTIDTVKSWALSGISSNTTPVSATIRVMPKYNNKTQVNNNIATQTDIPALFSQQII